MPGLTIGDHVPNLEVHSTHGKFKLQDFIKGSWAVVFSHPADFTPAGKANAYTDELERRGVKLVGVSCDSISSHLDWLKRMEYHNPGFRLPYPIVMDVDHSVIRELNMVDPEEEHWSGADSPSRSLHVVGPDARIKLSILYPASAGRNMDEVVRVVDSLQKTAMFKIATPVNWRIGEPVVISPSVTNDEANKMFPQGYRIVDLPSKKEYLRFTKL
jgi:1-Cys peroxiredoxin 6